MFTLPSPSIDDRKNQSAVVSLPLNMEPFSEYYTSGVTVLDFKSLYPSVIIAHNLCYSTILGNKEKFLPNCSEVSHMHLSLPLKERIPCIGL